MDKVLPLLISAGIIAFGDWVVVATIAKGSSFVWTLMALFPLLTRLISFYDSTKGTPAPSRFFEADRVERAQVGEQPD